MRFEVKTVSFENIERCCSVPTHFYPWINQLDWNFHSSNEKNIADGLMVASCGPLVGS